MPLGRIFGAQVTVSWPFLALLALGVAFGYWPQVLILLGTLCTHELAHMAVARGFELPIGRVDLQPFGGVARVDEADMDPHTETAVAIAGPLNNLMLAGLGALAQQVHWFQPDLLGFFIEANVAMAFFNLLPALPLDGGRIYRAYLSRKWGRRRVTSHLAAAGRIVALLLVLLGVVGIAFGRLYLGPLIMAFFLYLAARQEEAWSGYAFWLQHFRKKQALRARQQTLPVQSLAVHADTPLGELTGHFMARRYHIFTLTDSHLRALGTLDEGQVADALLERGPGVTLREVWESAERDQLPD